MVRNLIVTFSPWLRYSSGCKQVHVEFSTGISILRKYPEPQKVVLQISLWNFVVDVVMALGYCKATPKFRSSYHKTRIDAKRF